MADLGAVMGAKTARRRPQKRPSRARVVGTSGRTQTAGRRGAFTASLARSAEPADHAFRRYRRNVVLVLTVGVAAAADTTRYESFGLIKVTLLYLGALALSVLWVLSWVRERRVPRWRNGLHWPVIGLVAWTAVTTITSIDPRLSLRGVSASYVGLLFAVALAVVFFATAESIGLAHLARACAVLWYGAGGVVIGYGALQLHDRLTSWGGTWDPVDWSGGAGLADTWIFSTLGNPNHLAGAIAMLLPLGIVVGLTQRQGALRLLSGAMVLAGISELLHTTARGAWLAVLVSVPVLVLLLWREVRAHLRTALVAGGVLVLATLIALAAVGEGDRIPRQFASIFDTNGHTTVERVELWRSAWQMALDRPVVGYGPDTYRVRFNRYQTQRFVEEDGPEQGANGPHNTFLAHLAHLGFPGLALFLGLLGLVALRGVGALRRLRRRNESPPTPEDRQAARARLLVAGLVAAALAYLVQASFNTDELVLVFLFWVVLGLVAGASVDAGVPSSFRPSILLARVPGQTSDGERASAPAPALRPGELDGWTVLAGVVALALALPLGWTLLRPYRADAPFLRAERVATTAHQYFDVVDTGRFSSRDAERARAAADEAIGLYQRAIDLDPWHPLYRSHQGQLLFRLGMLELGYEEIQEGIEYVAARHLEQALRLYEQAVDLSGGEPRYLIAHAELVAGLLNAKAPRIVFKGNEAVVAYRAAWEANPWSPRAAIGLANAHLVRGDRREAEAVLEEALERRRSTSVDVLVAAARFYELDEATLPRSKALWAQVLELAPTNAEARRALQSGPATSDPGPVPAPGGA